MSVLIGLLLGLCMVMAGEGSPASWMAFGLVSGLAILGHFAVRNLDRRAKWSGRD